MLRRKLLILFGSLVVLLVILAASAIWVLRGALEELDRVNVQTMQIVDEVNQLNDALSTIEVDLYQIQLGHEYHLDRLTEDVEGARDIVLQLDKHYAEHIPSGPSPFKDMIAMYPSFEHRISSLSTAQDKELARKYTVEALADAMALRQGGRKIDENIRAHARQEQDYLAVKFRWLVFGIAVGCLLVINVSIIALLWAAGMVLRPVDRLVEASRQLTSEHFDHRTELAETDEFGELARAYNQLAERIQSSEQKRMEMLSQVALTLNHELNNSIAIIELQLQMLGRQSEGGDRFETCLRHIKENLNRMAQTVESLKHIRRIVLTDYISGVKMLDLQRSVQPAGEAEHAGEQSHIAVADEEVTESK